MATFSKQIVASGDDGEYSFQTGTDFDASGTRIWCISNIDAAITIASFFRFTNVTIPAGSTITAATIEVDAYSEFSPDANFRIHMNDVDDAVAPTNVTEGKALVATTASTAWVEDGVAISVATSPDFTAAVQEVVDRAGWASGQDMMVMFLPNTNNTRSLRVRSYDNAGTIPEITITYTAPSSAIGSTNLLKSTLLSSTLLSSPLIRS